MKIRIIGSKLEIETFCKILQKDFPDIIKSKLYTAHEGSYRCYISVKDSVKGSEK